MNKHLMIDFETLGQKPSTVVLSLGSVLFTREKILAESHLIFNIQQQKDAGRTTDASTIAWWEKQGAEAKKLFERCESTEAVPVMSLPSVVNKMIVDGRAEGVRLWSNGADFDIPIMKNIYDEFKAVTLVKYYDQRCYRTIKSIYGIEYGQKRSGVKHDALDDARYQAQCLQVWLNADPGRDK